GQVLDRHGTFQGTIGGVLFPLTSAGRGGRCGSARRRQWGLRASNPDHKRHHKIRGAHALRICFAKVQPLHNTVYSTSSAQSSNKNENALIADKKADWRRLLSG